jgi:thioredoxin 1
MGCEEQTPINREVSADLDVDIEEIDAVKNQQYIRDFSLKVTPTIIILAGEKEIKRFEGVVHREELEASIRAVL